MPFYDEEGNEIEYVRPTKNRRGYWRKVPYTRKHPTVQQRKARALFGRSAHSISGGKGKELIVSKDGKLKEVPLAAASVKDNMESVRLAPEKPRKMPSYAVASLDTIKKMAELLREIKELGT